MAPIRRNFAHLTLAEREAYANAVRDADQLFYADLVSYWDKQDQIHQGTHNHDGNSFIPWHRELCNRYEKLLQQTNPDVALYYWDWTQDPRNADDGQGGTVSLCENTTMGTANGIVAGTLASLHNGNTLAGSRDDTGNPADPPRKIERNCAAGAPAVASDAALLASGAALPQAQQWTAFRAAVESSHDTAHGFFGVGSNIRQAHSAFEDPFVYLLHANVDRLFAEWQTTPGQEWRLDRNQVYGDQSATADSKGILHNLQPWDGTVEFGAPIEPWVGASASIEVKNSRHPSVVAPPCYDTLPLTVEQVAPQPGDPIRFLDVYEGLTTARALRLRIRGCRPVTCQAVVAGDPAFSLQSASVNAQHVDVFTTQDIFVWVLFEPGAVGSTPSGTLTATVPETGDTFVIPIEANVVDKPTVASSLVLDRSGSMDLPSGVAGALRIDILRSSAPLFVNLLGDDDGVGVVRFDSDAVEAEPVQQAGPQIGGVGRGQAANAITTHTTNLLGMTAIGDGVVAAETQLNAVAAQYAERATVVFTDGHETEALYISDVMSSITDKVFAIGLGTADQLNPGALMDLSNGTGGYVLLTGNPTADDQILLQKYFAQVLAGVTNADIVVDPEGFVPASGKASVPYLLTEADRRSDVIVLSPAASPIRVKLEAPDGTTFDGASGAVLVSTPTYQTLRLALPHAKTAGTWHAHLSLDSALFKRYLSQLDRDKNKLAAARATQYGIPFTLSVQAHSSLHLGVRISQSSRRPGSHAIVHATLTQAGIPLDNSAALTAHVTAPNGSNSATPLALVDSATYTGVIATPDAGVYRVNVRAVGSTLAGHGFTREELRTIGVWHRGDDTGYPSSTGPGQGSTKRPAWCELLSCLSKDRALQQAARDRGIDLSALLKCLERQCK